MIRVPTLASTPLEPRDADRLDAIVRRLDRWTLRQALLGDPTVQWTVQKVVMLHWRQQWRPPEAVQEGPQGVPQGLLPYRAWWLYERR